MTKRLFDLCCSLLGLIFLVPLFFVVGLMIRVDGGPVFFRQERVGWKCRIFRIYKFRSMVVNAEILGAAVTAENDPRITLIGRWLRKTKLDELPQLLNVFFGDMSFVGPRPEVPYYVNLWSEADRELILSVKPGITDYATLYYHDEQALLAKADNPEKIYIEEVMPHKLEMYKDYVKDSNFLLDLKIILATLGEMIGFSYDILALRK
jgi:lipopolysaccharide/colanic/teichoic acid biosynthesis glycosyltransferase